MKKNILIKMINFWPPFLGAGIKTTRISPDFREIDVELNLRFYNRNYVGTQYGGSLYSMTDPFYMLMLLENLGREYIVWDKTAAIRFKKPGKGRVRCEFRLTEEKIQEIKRALEQEGVRKIEPIFTVLVKDDQGEIIAEVDKGLYIKKKDAATRSGSV